MIRFANKVVFPLIRMIISNPITLFLVAKHAHPLTIENKLIKTAYYVVHYQFKLEVLFVRYDNYDFIPKRESGKLVTILSTSFFYQVNLYITKRN